MKKKIYLSDEDKMMRDPNIKWTSSSIITKAPEEWTEEAKEGAKIAASIGLSLDDLDDSGDMAEELEKIMNDDQ